MSDKFGLRKMTEAEIDRLKELVRLSTIDVDATLKGNIEDETDNQNTNIEFVSTNNEKTFELDNSCQFGD